ncbi:MAG: N-acetylmuramoyl-L-alanine amidase [Polaribacter sp.]|nr:N-acetylmuramoyl-L-alanine amidase [Polaribacter sp.]MDB9830720.1 N-acetylmuramoyl-L-alanine amidase [Polaribacter sp.]MDC1375172.1 N-acetylmuramoyl-L-alanine amidase [Polaribacter sp.]MDG1320924.1 N-acetylmuramoyl-L-alanine amidase [Polaribacter sp.]
MNFLRNHKIKSKTKNIFFLAFFCFFMTASLELAAQKKYVVVLDAGHGGKDPGNTGNGYKEKNIALKVAVAVGKQLQKEDDIKVVFTRDEDVFIDLWKRGDIANQAKADLFVSIHCDSHTSNAYGAGTFVLGIRGNKKNLEIAKRENAVILLEDNYKRYEGFDPNSAESMIGLSLLQEENLDKSLTIASYIQSNFTKKLKRLDRKVKQDNFQVLRETIMPSVLIELGFLTNRNEGRYLNSKKGQKALSNSIALAIKKYINQLKLNTISMVDEVVIEKSMTEIQYKIQIASGKNKIATKSYNFRGLRNVERVDVGSFFKYYYSNSKVLEKAKKALKLVKRKGYKTAYIVAFKNGERIPLKEAQNMQ